VSVHRIMGVESEYGILAPNNPKANPVTLSTQVVNAYSSFLFPNRLERMRWDYDVETPLQDSRGYALERADASTELLTDSDYGVPNVVLPNGGRFYVDHAHPEYASPEVSNPWDAALWDVAGDRIMAQAAKLASGLTGELIVAYKNNSDGKGASYGTHENYQVQRDVDFDKFVDFLTPFFVTRSIFVGSGRVGIGQEGRSLGFQISSRADFFEAQVGLETTVRRPIINTRDEPHADANIFRRLHVIVGDANMSQESTYLKMGITAIVLSMIEADYLNDKLSLVNPVSAMHQVSHDLDLSTTLKMQDGRNLSAIAIQRIYLSAAQEFIRDFNINDDMTIDVLERWSEILKQLETDKMILANRVDWIAKLSILQGYLQRDGRGWLDPRLATVDLQYADLRPDKGLALMLQNRSHMNYLFSEAQVSAAVENPPIDTRAYFRGQCVKHFGDLIHAGSWDSVIFESGLDERLIRILTPDARKGTEHLTSTIFDQNINLHDFLKALSADNQTAIV